MILLDTNYLIRALLETTFEAERVDHWLDQDEELCTASIAWYEFLSGPVDQEGIDLTRAMVCDRVLPFTGDVAAEAARLYDATGRIRWLRVDATLAATAIIADARLATENETNFRIFTSEGLRLALGGARVQSL